jgi:hypothetical protein
MKHNVIIPVWNREKYLKQCVSGLQHTASIYNMKTLFGIFSDISFFDREKNTRILIATDEENNDIYNYLNTTKAYGSDVIYVNLNKTAIQKNKASFINGILGQVEEYFDFDIVSIVDVDMIYNPSFYYTIEQEIDDDTYIISSGYKLSEKATMELFKTKDKITYSDITPDMIDPEYELMGNTGAYPSQITLTKNLYNKILDIMQSDKLYSEEFLGWGGEDSYLSFFSRHCAEAGLFKKKVIPDMWYHLWHPPADKSNIDINLEKLYTLDEVNKRKIAEYIKRNGG